MEMAQIIKWHRDRQAWFSHHGEPWGAMGRDSKRIADSLEAMQENGKTAVNDLRNRFRNGNSGWPY